MARRTVPAPEPVEDAEAAAAPAEEPPALGFEKWMGFLSHFIAPASLIAALLFYFGYVASSAFFRYFGVDVDVLGLSNQEFVMRSPGALFMPIMVLLLLAAALIVGHRLVRRLLGKEDADVQRRTVSVIAWTGIVILIVGLVLAFSYGALAGWELYGFLTPACLAIGAGLAAYAASAARRLSGGTQGRALTVLLVAVMVAGTFWATSEVAEWWGRGQARILAADLTTLPAVIVDTKERLNPGNPAIAYEDLAPPPVAADDGEEDPPDAETVTYRYRYFGMRLLVRGGDYLFLVPDQWSSDASTYVMKIEDSRWRFRFFPDADPPN